MKDLYTFDRTEADALATYAEIRGAYDRIFARLGLPFRAAEADTGDIGGSTSHEYHYPSPAGEDTLLSCRSCGYSANEERAVARRVDPQPHAATPLLPLLAILQAHGLAGLARQLGAGAPELPSSQLLLGWRLPEGGKDEEEEDASLVFVCLRAGATLHSAALHREPAVQGLTLHPIDDREAIQVLERMGSSGRPSTLTFLRDASDPLPEGAEEEQVRALGPRASVHFSPLTFPRAGDVCTHCHTDTPLHAERSIEVGHTFLLGTKYSAPLGASFRDPERSPEPLPIQMGCYGIGISRLLAAVVEGSHDARGMRWPRPIAPYTACILPFPDRAGEDVLATAATTLHEALVAAGHDVLLDDRADVRPGAKMKDADLVGYPYAILVGKEFLASGRFEVQPRGTGSAARPPPQALDQAGLLSLLAAP
jgi:prolyl-tRNA synthetase